MTNIQKELIAIEVIRTLYAQFEKFPEDETNNRTLNVKKNWTRLELSFDFPFSQVC